jgi:hypothetical protein
MLSRSTTSSLAGRQTAMRRMRRRTSAAGTGVRPPYCSTNGCTSFLDVDPTTGAATCPICGYVRRPH